jgi:hypothetical protein
MQQMTFMECVKRAWASARDAAKQMPLLMLGAFVAFTALTSLVLLGRPAPGQSVPLSTGAMLATNLASVLSWAVYLIFVIKIHRFVLLREPATPLVPLGGKPFLRSFGVSLLIAVVLIVATFVLLFVLRPHHAGGIAFLVAVAGVFWAVLAVRLSLLFPSLALGHRIDLRAAWHDSRGHFWSLLGVPCVAVLPVIGCWIVISIAAGVMGITPSAAASREHILLFAAVQDAVSLAFTVISVSALSWLYRRHADKLPAAPEA